MVGGEDGGSEVQKNRGGEGMRGWRREKEVGRNKDMVNMCAGGVSSREGQGGMKERKGRDQVVGGGGEEVEERVWLGGAGGWIRIEISKDNELEIRVGVK